MVSGSFEYLMSRVCVTNPGKTRTHNPDDIPFAFFFFFYKSIFALKTALFFSKKRSKKKFRGPNFNFSTPFSVTVFRKFLDFEVTKGSKNSQNLTFFLSCASQNQAYS